MREFARFLIWLPIAAASDALDLLTRDRHDRIIAKHHADFIAQHTGE